ncbi:MAG: 50S ribosomal protein L5 [Chloroflexi bacterium]|nr:50S ribosomal protein L5 [Chloroflexota bacterium]
MTTQATENGVEGPRLKQRFETEIAPRLFDEFRYGNVMQVPRVVKVVVNAGVGEALGPGGAAILENCVADITTITGQKPVINKAKKSIANFKLRAGNNVGVSCTLRGARMWEFLDRTINAALPRIRDFQGVSRTAFDGRGNYSLGIREQIVFPEIDYGNVDKVRSLQVNIITTARTDAEGRRLLELLGFPFERTQ